MRLVAGLVCLFLSVAVQNRCSADVISASSSGYGRAMGPFGGQYYVEGIDPMDMLLVSAGFSGVAYSFGVVGFDLSTQTGPLAQATLSLTPNSAAGAQGTRPYPVAIVALDAPFSEYTSLLPQDMNTNLAGAQPLIDWYQSNVAGGNVIGNISIDVGDNSTVVQTLDVTNIVNSWIDGSVPNYGFAAFIPDAGKIFNFYGVGTGSRVPALTTVAVPEPCSALVSVIAVSALVRRHRINKKKKLGCDVA